MRRCAALFTAGKPAGYDVIVSGGGLVGAATMASLQLLRKRLREQSAAAAGADSAPAPSAPGPLDRLMMVDTAQHPVYDSSNMMHKLRTVSITPVSSKIVDNLGGWAALTTKHSYYRIAVRHEQVNGPQLAGSERSQSFVMSKFLGKSASTEPVIEFTDLRKPVGFICYNTELNATMLSVVEETMSRDTAASTDVLAFESKLESVRLPSRDGVDGPLGKALLKTSPSAGSQGNVEVDFRLLLGCEGRGSPLRDLIASPSVQHDYAQTAFVCDVRIDRADDGNVCCFQNFFRDGMIIAFLPTSADTANIVFTTTAAHAAELTAMSQSDLVAELNGRLHAFAPHDIPKIVEVPEGTFNGQHRRAQGKFPLKLNFATTPYAPRAILLGDAAHGIHPFAGQGLNLGIYDTCALADVLESAIRSGQDIGNSVSVGQVFAGEMVAHTAPMIGGMEAIKHLVAGLPGLSCVGMKMLNTLPVLSTFGKDAVLQVSSGALFASRHSKCFLLQ